MHIQVHDSGQRGLRAADVHAGAERVAHVKVRGVSYATKSPDKSPDKSPEQSPEGEVKAGGQLPQVPPRRREGVQQLQEPLRPLRPLANAHRSAVEKSQLPEVEIL